MLSNNPTSSTSGMNSSLALFVVTQCSEIGSLKKSSIYKIEGVSTIAFYTSEYEELDKSRTIQELKRLLSLGTFFFSYDYPLTTKMETIFQLTKSKKRSSSFFPSFLLKSNENA